MTCITIKVCAGLVLLAAMALVEPACGDLREDLDRVAEKLADGEDSPEDYAEAMNVLRQVLVTRPKDVEPQLIRIAELSDFLGIAKCKANGDPIYSDTTCRLALHCLWMTSRPLDYFRKSVDQWRVAPLLAGFALQMLARTGDPELLERFGSIRAELKHPNRHVRGPADNAVPELGAILGLKRNLEALDAPARLAKLIERATEGRDWCSEPIAPRINAITFGEPNEDGEMEHCHTAAYLEGREFCRAHSYWARDQLLAASTEDPAGVAKAIFDYKFSMEWQDHLTGGPKVDISALFREGAIAILKRDALTEAARLELESLEKGGK